MGMPSRRTNNFPESGRGLGHVTPTIFGSTVGYPGDSLASCDRRCQTANEELQLQRCSRDACSVGSLISHYKPRRHHEVNVLV